MRRTLGLQLLVTDARKKIQNGYTTAMIATRSKLPQLAGSRDEAQELEHSLQFQIVSTTANRSPVSLTNSEQKDRRLVIGLLVVMCPRRTQSPRLG